MNHRQSLSNVFLVTILNTFRKFIEPDFHNRFITIDT